MIISSTCSTRASTDSPRISFERNHSDFWTTLSLQITSDMEVLPLLPLTNRRIYSTPDASTTAQTLLPLDNSIFIGIHRETGEQTDSLFNHDEQDMFSLSGLIRHLTSDCENIFTPADSDSENGELLISLTALGEWAQDTEGHPRIQRDDDPDRLE